MNSEAVVGDINTELQDVLEEQKQLHKTPSNGSSGLRKFKCPGNNVSETGSVSFFRRGR
jgi:hypothetical protein